MEYIKLLRVSNSRTLFPLLVLLSTGIFLSEVIAMLLVQFHDGPYWITILFDAIITTTLMFPAIYFLSYRPLLKHVSEQKRADTIMRVRLRLMQFSVSHTLDDLLQETINEIEALTDSTIGFFHFVDDDQKTLRLQAWSTNTLENMCKADGKGSHYSIEQAGVWADAIRERRPIVHNDYEALAHRKGTPEGHAQLIREMTIPILRDNKVVAILGVGNKAQEYNSTDIELVSPLADFIWDIVQHKRAEDALRTSEQNFRTLVDWTYDCEQWIDPQGNIVYISPSCERITGYTQEHFISDPELLARIVHPDDRKSYNKHRLLVHDETAGIDNVEYRIITRDGQEHWIDHICRPLFGEDNRYLGRRVTNRDITARKLAEKEIAERNEKETMLTQTIHNMQIEIARDLHDTIGQNIGFLRMKLDHLSETNLLSQIDVKSEAANMLKVANESYDLIRGTLSVLRSGGLADPLTLFVQYSNQVEERSSFNITVASQGEPRPLSPAQVRQLFFVFREALSNIEKHANASQVLVEFIWDENSLVLLIEDNGRGINLDDTRTRNHYGLKFMQERINLLDGSLEIQSAKEQGTQIKIDLPYKQKLSALAQSSNQVN